MGDVFANTSKYKDNGCFQDDLLYLREDPNYSEIRFSKIERERKYRSVN